MVSTILVILLITVNNSSPVVWVAVFFQLSVGLKAWIDIYMLYRNDKGTDKK